MIFLRISSSDANKIDQVAEILIKENLAMDLNLKPNVQRLEMNNGILKKKQIWMLTAKTKGMLFSEIDKRLRKEFNKEMPELYSTPIVHMDWEQSELLAKSLKQV